MCIVKEGPDVALFTHPAALTKLALWVGEAIAQQEKEFKGKLGYGGRGTPLVIASLNESRGIYVMVGTGGGGGSCAGLRDQQAIKEKKERLEAKARAKDQDRRNKELIRNQRKEARRLALGDETDQENETEIDSSTSSSEESESEQEDIKNNYMKGFGRNKFGNAFQEVIEETNARIRIDSFEHCVVEVKKEDLAAFLESLSLRAVIG